jgi:hypothetical protein
MRKYYFPKVLSCLFIFWYSANKPFAQSVQPSAIRQMSPEWEMQSGLWSWVKEDDQGSSYRILINRQQLSRIWESEPAYLWIRLPERDGKVRTLKFERNYLTDSTFNISTSDGRVLTGKEFAGLHYTVVPEKDCKVGGISFREDGLMACINLDGSAISIGEKVPGSGRYFLSFDADQKMPEWDCGSDQLPDFIRKDSEEKPADNKAVSTICKTVRIYLEADLDLYAKSGNSLTTAANFVTGLFNVVKQVYANAGINLQLSGIFQWTSTDPYVSMTSSSQILTAFTGNRPASSVNTDLLHLLSSRQANLGGIGYIGVLCNTVYRHAFSNILYKYSALPTYSWSVYCMAHELGHNFGSRHTQWCGWTLSNGTLGRIDSCYAGEGSCGTLVKARVGTIMSYCHLSAGVDLNKGFGPLPVTFQQVLT